MKTPTKALSEREFVALVAMLFASMAFAIDAMLPALSTIGAELSPSDPARSALVVGIFVLGMGTGTLFSGPLSDAYGRKPLIIWPYLIFIAGSVLAANAPTLEILLIARFIQGLALSGPRIAGLAMVRDLYSGPKMAAVMSMAMMVFGLVPAIAPLLGQVILNMFNWQAIFYSMVIFGVVVSLWYGSRQGESHVVSARRPLKISSMWEAAKYAFGNRVFRYSVAVQTVLYSALFLQISLIQPVFEIYYDKADTFPLWFGAIAVLTMSASFINARIVGRLGMRKIIQGTLGVQVVFSSTVIAVFLISGGLAFWLYFIWAVSVMLMVGFTFGNLNALAMEPMGKIAGMAASIAAGISTILSALISMMISLTFDGTPLPLTIGVFGCVVVGLTLMRILGPRRATDES
ncbi:multidrug effflux MFS transporter [Yoonia sp. MH D7]